MDLTKEKNDPNSSDESKEDRNICLITNYKTCDSLKHEIEDLYQTLSRFTRVIDDIDMITYNQRVVLIIKVV